MNINNKNKLINVNKLNLSKTTHTKILLEHINNELDKTIDLINNLTLDLKHSNYSNNKTIITH